MANKFDIIIGIDPGLSGGISIVEEDNTPVVCGIPLRKIIVNKKNKNTLDMISIVSIFEKYKNKKVLFYIEKQMGFGHESAVSTMTIGKNYGQLMGVAYAFGFNIVETTSQSWKKQFPELVTQGIVDKKAEIKGLREFFKKELEKLEVLGKTLKDKRQKKANKEQVKLLKKDNKKQIDRLNRQVKAEAKTNARELVMKLYPKIADKFIKKGSDGLAESALIVLYDKEHQNELV